MQSKQLGFFSLVSIAASALGQYIQSIFPGISTKWAGVAVTTLVFVVNHSEIQVEGLENATA